MMWKCVHDYMKKYRAKLRLDRQGNMPKSDLIYPNKEESLKVIFLWIIVTAYSPDKKVQAAG